MQTFAKILSAVRGNPHTQHSATWWWWRRQFLSSLACVHLSEVITYEQATSEYVFVWLRNKTEFDICKDRKNKSIFHMLI